MPTRLSHALSIPAIILVLVLACTSSPGDALPSHHLTGGGPTALLTGRLIDDGGCLFSESVTGHSWMIVWPRGFSRAGQSVFDRGQHVASVGDTVSLGGGEYHEGAYDFLRTLMDQDIRLECRGGDYWLAISVSR